jgi:geranylgeranyl reductase family protein
MLRVDVAIVGAGPAGSRAAFGLARAGARVALIDGSHPREKPCGGGVTGRALALVRDAIDASRLDAVTIEHAAFEDRARRVRVAIGQSPNDLPRLAVVARRQFDQALLVSATRAGAGLVAARATGVERCDRLWQIATTGGAVQAEWLFGADGPGSLVRRRVHRPFERAELSIASGCFVHGATSREIGIAFAQEPAGYLWSFPRRDHLAVGACGQADVATAKGLHQAARRWIDANIPSPHRLERYSWPIPSLTAAALDREAVSGPGWLLLGDAAGLVDPITREGIYFALASGEMAAASVLGGRRAAESYGERIRDTIHAELRRAAVLKSWFFRPDISALVVAALGRSARIRDVMADLVAGSQPYQGLRRRLLRTFEWRLMLELVAVSGRAGTTRKGTKDSQAIA